MDELRDEIIDLAIIYFKRMDESIKADYLETMVDSIIDCYKNLRNYPDDYSDEMIEADCVRYFSRRKNNVAFEMIPEMYGRMGSEGLSMLTDNGITRMWKNATTFSDVVPICEVV